MTDTNATQPSDVIVVSDNRDLSRYEAHLSQRILGIVEYDFDPSTNSIVLVHTEVLPDAEGMGVGSRLARGALEDVRERGLKVTVECEFIAAYLKRHRGEYDDILAD